MEMMDEQSRYHDGAIPHDFIPPGSQHWSYKDEVSWIMHLLDGGNCDAIGQDAARTQTELPDTEA